MADIDLCFSLQRCPAHMGWSREISHHGRFNYFPQESDSSDATTQEIVNILTANPHPSLKELMTSLTLVSLRKLSRYEC